MLRKESEKLAPNISPLRIKKKQNINEAIMPINDRIYEKEQNLASIRNSFNYISQHPQDRENISLYSNQNYAMTQKHLMNSSGMMLDPSQYSVPKNCKTTKHDPTYRNQGGISEHPSNHYEKVRLLDSRLTEGEMFLDPDELCISRPHQRNAEKHERVAAHGILNNSYDDIRNKTKLKHKVNNTHRKEMKRSKNIELNS